MLERTTTRSYFEDILCDEFEYITKEDLCTLSERKTRSRGSGNQHQGARSGSDGFDFRFRQPAVAADAAAAADNCATGRPMTGRKTRTRRPPVQAIQSGYCAICNVPYNNVEDHIQSKKHQKLIGEDANYIALNGYVHPDVGIESLLSLNGIDAIGLDQDFSPRIRRRGGGGAMPRTRAASVASERVPYHRTRASSVAPASPPERSSAPRHQWGAMSPRAAELTNGHHLRSRRQLNYATPPLDDEGVQGEFEQTAGKHQAEQFKEYRELRSSTKAFAKLTSPPEPEVWNSGRPKRSCSARHKRLSIDEKPDDKTYYKVEVLSSKLRTDSSRDAEKKLKSPKREEEKGLIVKFKKLRNTELIQLNNEATNFLFPKKDDSSEDETDDAETSTTTTTDSKADAPIVVSSSDTEDCKSPKFKIEDESSMDSTISSDTSKKKRKRRTQAEMFIADNQKYYKFDSPGSSSCRLRYHGSYLSPILKGTDNKTDTFERRERPCPKRLKLNMKDYTFSFETVPKNETWYNTFQRQDKGEQRYNAGYNYFWDEFILPYQMPFLKPLCPKVCWEAYKYVKEPILNPVNVEHSSSSDNSEQNSRESVSLDATDIEMQDEDSKISASGSLSAESMMEEQPVIFRRRGRRCKVNSDGKNPRKSPRQHASTLAILSSLLHQRKRRSRNKDVAEASVNLPPIPEESDEKPPDTPGNTPVALPQTPLNNAIPSGETPQKSNNTKTPVLKTPMRRRIPKPDYFAIANKIEDELDTALDDDLENFDIDIVDSEPVDFRNIKVTVGDILTLSEKVETTTATSKGLAKRSMIYLNGRTRSPIRKPCKRKKNKTGWPKKIRRVKKGNKEKENEENSSGSGSVNNLDLEDDNSTDSINGAAKDSTEALNVNRDKCDLNNDDRVENGEFREQQFSVRVQRIVTTSRRTAKAKRRMPGSPKSPKMLRKPRGRWYRER